MSNRGRSSNSMRSVTRGPLEPSSKPRRLGLAGCAASMISPAYVVKPVIVPQSQ
jgi:hypothetical protein